MCTRAATRLSQRGLTALGLVFHWDSVTRVLNPPTPFQGSDQAFVRTKAQDYRFAVLRPASDDALIKTLRAAFASSTYLLSEIHGPGRSFDDDLLIPHHTPVSRGRSGPTGFPSPQWLSLPANSGRASDDALLIPLRLTEKSSRD